MYCRPSSSIENLLQSNCDREVPIPAPRHRRRLEDPVFSHSSNYYTLYPSQRLISSSTPPIPLPRRISSSLKEQNDVLCDLYNLLDRPSSPPPIKPRRIFSLINQIPLRPPRRIDLITEQRSFVSDHHYEESDDRSSSSSSTHYYNRLKEKRKINLCIHQGFLSRKNFFRRVARNYFCIPMTIEHRTFSNENQ